MDLRKWSKGSWLSMQDQNKMRELFLSKIRSREIEYHTMRIKTSKLLKENN